MSSILLERLKNSPTFLSQYTQGMSYIYQSGLLEYLRDAGRVPTIAANTPNYDEVQKYVAAQSIGFNYALDLLIYFREIVLDVAKKEVPKMDFGGIDKALRDGDLTKEEADAIRNGQPIPSLKSESDAPAK